MERLGARRERHRGGARPLHRPGVLRGRPGIRRRLRRGGRGERPLLRPEPPARAIRCSTCTAYIAERAAPRRRRPVRGPRARHLRRRGALLQLPPHDPSQASPTTAGSSRRSRSPRSRMRSGRNRARREARFSTLSRRAPWSEEFSPFLPGNREKRPRPRRASATFSDEKMWCFRSLEQYSEQVTPK